MLTELVLIIVIYYCFRHAKQVHEQNTRERVLSIGTPRVPVAKVSANPSVSPFTNSPAPKTNLGNLVVAPPTKPRRVLPEHEGKYKITLPTGSTPRSREILAKQNTLNNTPKQDVKRPAIFNRLKPPADDLVTSTNSTMTQTVRITGLNSKQNSSIFSRLGGKTSDNQSMSNILSMNKTSKAIIKPPLAKQKVILVTKIPAKATLDLDRSDEEDDRMDIDHYKSVSFSSEDEIVEIAPRRVNKPKQNNISMFKNNDSVKSRLGQVPGDVKVKASTSHPLSKNMKKNSSSSLLTGRLLSDQMNKRKPASVKSRLNMTPTNKLSNRVVKSNSSFGKDKLSQASVFNRLGKN